MAFSLITSNAGAIVTVRSRLSLHLRRSFCTITATSASREMAKVGVVQMTSTNDLEANFLTCSRLVKEAAVEGVKLLLTLRSYCCHWYSERKYQISHASWYSERKYQISHATGTLRSYCYCCH